MKQACGLQASTWISEHIFTGQRHPAMARLDTDTIVVLHIDHMGDTELWDT